MPVARNAGPWRHLLGSKRKVVRASARINFEDDLAAGVRQAFPIVRTKKVTPRFHVLGVGDIRHHSLPLFDQCAPCGLPAAFIHRFLTQAVQGLRWGSRLLVARPTSRADIGEAAASLSQAVLLN